MRLLRFERERERGKPRFTNIDIHFGPKFQFRYRFQPKLKIGVSVDRYKVLSNNVETSGNKALISLGVLWQKSGTSGGKLQYSIFAFLTLFSPKVVDA